MFFCPCFIAILLSPAHSTQKLGVMREIPLARNIPYKSFSTRGKEKKKKKEETLIDVQGCSNS